MNSNYIAKAQTLCKSIDTYKVILFLTGMFFGLISTFLLLLPYRTPEIVELDLGKIITNFSIVMAKDDKPTAKVRQEFKEKFQKALLLIPKRTIIVSKGQVLSKHKVVDSTEMFLANMGVKYFEPELSK